MSTISELFNRDPLALTVAERDLIVAYYKENRDKFMLLDPKTGEPKPKKVRVKKAKAKPVDPNQLDLVDSIEKENARDD